MNILNKILIFSIASTLMMSCGEEWLEETDPNRISTDIYWANLDETETTLVSTYAALMDESVLSIEIDAWRSDMGWPGFGRPIPNKSDLSLWYYHTYNASNIAIDEKWKSTYLVISRANQTIEGLEALMQNGDIVTEEEIDEWNIQMAQARFLRGLAHFYLHSAFNKGSIVIRDEVAKTTEEYSKPLSTSEEVISFFRTDLRFAEENLPVAYDEGNQGRATSGAAATILGTSYLYEADYDSAIFFLEKVENGDAAYALVRDTDLQFTTAGEMNEESIFEISYENGVYPTRSVWDGWSLTNRLAQSHSSDGWVVPAWLVWKYKKEEMDTFDIRNYYTVLDNNGAPIPANEPSRLAHIGSPLDSMLVRNVPLRCSKMIAIVEDEQTEYYQQPSATESLRNAHQGWGFAYYKKYSNYDILSEITESDQPNGGVRASGKNVTVNRLADVYLMLAEAYLEKEGSAGLDMALMYINRVRERWGLKLRGQSSSSLAEFSSKTYEEESYTYEMLRDTLRFIEKPLEMSVEGHQVRWIDLRRWGVLKENFEKLASETYYLHDYTFIDSKGSDQTRLRMSVQIDATGSSESLDHEYEISALNFNEEAHAYFPIPLSELQSNASIK
ncbi:RagB/SusD family nutrient uptake outer membrane protein [Reichenbachiella versicolor]|uniref:RagB/SusD family nutrient uptake outer membrane protein n=1 Tax=Reichenbachiella versicolor TaxID=1821036 RepID=UPI0013A56287|nr:RagB/SusD family nutrient uptake outer membrane protein [Reichenbachiella versicolor]